MAYTKRSYRRRAPVTSSKALGRKSRTKSSKGTLLRAVQQVLRSPGAREPRHISMKLIPNDANRLVEDVEFSRLEGDRWPAYQRGELSGLKYSLLPVTEAIPTQRKPHETAHDGQRPLDEITIKSLTLRMKFSQNSQVRVLVFAWRNSNRRDLEPEAATRPFVIKNGPSGIPVEIHYERLDKDALHGLVAEGESAVRHIGVNDGPFDVRRTPEGFNWYATDDTAFTAQFSNAGGRPIGNVSVKQNNSKYAKHGKFFCGNFSCDGVMQSMAMADGGVSTIGSTSNTVEVFIELNENERYWTADSSVTANQQPIELFLGFDTPEQFDGGQEQECAILENAILDVNYS